MIPSRFVLYLGLHYQSTRSNHCEDLTNFNQLLTNFHLIPLDTRQIAYGYLLCQLLVSHLIFKFWKPVYKMQRNTLENWSSVILWIHKAQLARAQFLIHVIVHHPKKKKSSGSYNLPIMQPVVTLPLGINHVPQMLCPLWTCVAFSLRPIAAPTTYSVLWQVAIRSL